VINGAVQAMGERFEGCRFELQVDAQLPEILADPDALTTVLVNLLDNAWKFSDEIKHIVLGAQSQNGNVVFWVKDHGIGIPSHESKNIFRRFYQVDQSLSRKGSGCGLGLSIAQYIVSAHQGRIWVESQPGAGSVFRVLLPASACRPVAEQKALG
jgi:signal transduction histidine kinase